MAKRRLTVEVVLPPEADTPQRMTNEYILKRLKVRGFVMETKHEPFQAWARPGDPGARRFHVFGSISDARAEARLREHPIVDGVWSNGVGY